MKKKIKFVTKKRKFRLGSFFTLVWLLAFGAYIATSVFVHSYNSTILSEIQKNEEEIAKLNESINILSLNVKELSTRERIVSIVKNQGLKPNPDNVVSVNNR